MVVAKRDSQVERADRSTNTQGSQSSLGVHVLRYLELLSHEHAGNATSALDDLQTAWRQQRDGLSSRLWNEEAQR